MNVLQAVRSRFCIEEALAAVCACPEDKMLGQVRHDLRRCSLHRPLRRLQPHTLAAQRAQLPHSVAI